MGADMNGADWFPTLPIFSILAPLLALPFYHFLAALADSTAHQPVNKRRGKSANLRTGRSTYQSLSRPKNQPTIQARIYD